MPKRPRRRPPPRSFQRSGIVWFMGAVVVGMLTLLLFLAGYVTVVTGHRSGPGRAVQGTLQNSFLQLIPLGTTQLPGLREAKLETIRDTKKSSSPTYRVLFVTDAGVIPMTSFARGGREQHQDLVERINAHLRDTEADSFSVRHVGAGWFALVPAAVVLVVLAALALWAIRVARRARAGVLARDTHAQTAEKTSSADHGRRDRGT